MGVKPYYPDKDPMTVGVGRSGRVADVVAEDTGSVTGVGSRPGGTDVAAADTLDFVLRQVAAGMQGGVPPQQFLDNIYAASRQLGNRAFLRWVSELRTRGRDTGSHTVAAGGGQAQQAACPAALSGPLQLMPKKRKKKEDVVEAGSEVAAQAGGDARTEAEPGARLLEAQSKEAMVAPGEKKKKKSRVKMALSALRCEGVEAFRGYIEAEIGEADLLRTLVERITRAQDLGSIKEAALKAVQTRLRSLSPEVGPGIAATSEPGPAKDPERPVVAQIKTVLSTREKALFEACFRGNLTWFKRLLRHGNIDINMYSQFGTPLGLAATKGHAAIVSELLSMPGIEVNRIMQNSGLTPLYCVALKGHSRVVKLLLAAHGIDVNQACRDGNTPLYAAVAEGHEEIVRLLLDMPNVNIDERMKEGVTALFYAARNNLTGIVEQLVRRGANVNQAVITGTTPLCSAAKRGHLQVVRILLQAPAIAVDQATDDGVTPVAIASQEGHKDTVRLLLMKGADPNIKHVSGITPLHLAGMCGHTAIVEMLLRVGSDMDVEVETEGERYTPYSLAQLAGRREVMSVLTAYRRGTEQDPDRLETLSPCLRLQGRALHVLSRGQALEVEPEWTTPPTTPPPEWTTPPTTPPPEWTTPPTTPPPEWTTPPTKPPPDRLTPPTTLLQPSTVSIAQPVETVAISAVLPENSGKSSVVPAVMPEAMEREVRGEMALADRATAGAAAELSPLAQVQDALRQEVLRKLEQDNLEPLEGIRLLEDVNASTDIDVLCALYNRLAHIERHKERARRRGRRREQLSVAVGALAADPASAGAPLFALGGREGLDAEGVEGEIRAYLEQRYHRFVGQVLNDMEFGRGKRTTGYPGMWHASAGISGVGSCSVFYYSDEETQRIRIVGIGHHVGRAAYRLDYATAELGGPGRILRIA